MSYVTRKETNRGMFLAKTQMTTKVKEILHNHQSRRRP